MILIYLFKKKIGDFYTQQANYNDILMQTHNDNTTLRMGFQLMDQNPNSGII